MYNYFVYLIKSESRLVILDKEKVSNDYYLLIKVDGTDPGSFTACNLFCIGFINGTRYNHLANSQVVNTVDEFAVNINARFANPN